MLALGIIYFIQVTSSYHNFAETTNLLLPVILGAIGVLIVVVTSTDVQYILQWALFIFVGIVVVWAIFGSIEALSNDSGAHWVAFYLLEATKWIFIAMAIWVLQKHHNDNTSGMKPLL